MIQNLPDAIIAEIYQSRYFQLQTLNFIAQLALAIQLNFFMFTLKRIFFIGIAVVVMGSIGYIYTSRNRDVRLVIQAPSEAYLGIPFELPIEIGNQSRSVLNDVTVAISLPPGAVFAGSNETKTLEQRQLGNVGEGSLVIEKIQLVFLQGKDTNQIIKVAGSYLTPKIFSPF